MPILVSRDRNTVGAANRQVDGAGVALPLAALRQEREALTVLVCDLLRPVLLDGTGVAGFERVRVAERDFLLADVALALNPLAVHASAVHTVADVTQQLLHAGSRE